MMPLLEASTAAAVDPGNNLKWHGGRGGEGGEGGEAANQINPEPDTDHGASSRK